MTGSPQWWWDEESGPWGENPSTVLAHMTRLFSAPEFLMSRFTRPQVGEGLWYVASEGASGYPLALYDRSLPWDLRRDALTSMASLFEHLFNRYCGDALGHLDRSGVDPLSTTCYMWWDLFCSWFELPEYRDQQLIHAVLTTMARILLLPSEACCEAALHGLGHAEPLDPATVRNIIDSFLARRPGISNELKAYAADARRGDVL